MKINYIKKGNYLIPKLGITTSTTNSINRYGLLKLNYIKKHKKQLYRNLLMNNQLTDYLSSVSNECNIIFDVLNRARLAQKIQNDKGAEDHQNDLEAFF